MTMSAEGAVTQEELDSLLASLAAAAREEGRSRRARRGAPVVHEARVHDFARSEGLPATAVQALEAGCHSFAAAVGASLSAHLSHPVQVSLLSVDQMSCEQYARSVPDPTVAGIFTASPLPGRGLLEVNPAIASWIVERALGGMAEAPERPRPLTELEAALLRRPLATMLGELGAAWQNIAPIAPKLVEITHSAALAEIARPTDPVAVASFEVRLGQLVGMASVCLPSLPLKLARRPAAGEGAPSPRPADVRRAAARLPVTCRVRLGATSLSLADLASLQEGDVLMLDRAVGEPIELLVGQRCKLLCRPLAVGETVAVEIAGDAAREGGPM